MKKKEEKKEYTSTSEAKSTRKTFGFDCGHFVRCKASLASLASSIVSYLKKRERMIERRLIGGIMTYSG